MPIPWGYPQGIGIPAAPWGHFFGFSFAHHLFGFL